MFDDALTERPVAALTGAAVAAATLTWVAVVCAEDLRRLLTEYRARVRSRVNGRLPIVLRVAAALVSPWVTAFRLRLPATWHRGLEAALRRAAIDADVQPLEWCLLPAPFVGVSIVLAAIASRPAETLALAAALSVVAPWLWLRQATRRRQLAVLREMPLQLDLLALALESGATLLLALRTSLPRTPAGPFRDALTGLLGDLQSGRTRVDAILALQRRVDFECVRPVTTAMIEADRSGAALAEMLRRQSEQRNHERFHRAEQLAMQAPVKMLGPLVLCIFPGTFIVLAFVVFARVSP